ncbi:hypothetical protein Cgig2_017122 [Carnegiea gigantea]|uniref:Peptidase A2 domain-containing protein n=1 Tax=Carnegiea gigantea TaxID=171969 RepID=A0A9Q1K3Q2_9CARY|nr:hypothetical protein Cgig2_017122 [Carnegiea gigantea]
MTYTITRQVSEQVQRAIEVANSASPLPHFDYVSTIGYEPSHRCARIPSPYRTKREREASWLNRSGRPYTGNHGQRAIAATRPSNHPVQGQTVKSTTTSISYATHSRRTVWLEEQKQTSKPRGEASGWPGHLMLWRPLPMTVPSKPHNVQKYYEFYKQNEHTTAECCELKKALHEVANKGQIDHFLKKGPRFLHGEQEPTQPQPQDEECFTKVVVTITGGYVEGMTLSAWKAQLRGVKQVLITEQGARIMVPTMVFGQKETLRFASPCNDPLVVEMKIASAIVRRILIDTGSSMNIITWDCLKKLTYPGQDIAPLMYLILGFGG